MRDLRDLLKPGDTVMLKNVMDMTTSPGSSKTLGELDDQKVIDEYVEFSEMVGTVAMVGDNIFTLRGCSGVHFFYGDIAKWPREFEMWADVGEMLDVLGI